MDDLDVEVIDKVRLWPSHASVDGHLRRVKWGAWAVYLPGSQLKLMHAVAGRQHCIYYKAPRREEVLGGFDKRPSAPDWARAFETPVLRRVAENWVMFARLHAAGLGPEPMGLVAVRDYRSFFSRGRGSPPGSGSRISRSIRRRRPAPRRSCAPPVSCPIAAALHCASRSAAMSAISTTCMARCRRMARPRSHGWRRRWRAL